MYVLKLFMNFKCFEGRQPRVQTYQIRDELFFIRLVGCLLLSEIK